MSIWLRTLQAYVLTCSCLALPALAEPTWQKERDLAAECSKKNDYAGAKEHYRSALKELDGVENADRADCLVRLARVMIEEGKKDPECEKALREALDLRKKLFGAKDKSYGLALYYLARFHQSVSRLEEAEKEILESIAIARDSDHSNLSSYLARLGYIYSWQKKYDLAAGALREAADVEKSDDLEYYCSCVNDLDSVLAEQEKYAESEKILTEAIALASSKLGDHAKIALLYDDLGTALSKQKKLKEAESAYLKAIQIATKILPKTSIETADYVRHLASCYSSQRDFEKSDAEFKKAEEYVKATGKEAELPRFFNDHGMMWLRANKYDAAISVLIEALAIRKKSVDLSDVRCRRNQSNLAATYKYASKWQESIKLLDELMKVPDLPKEEQIEYLDLLSGNFDEMREFNTSEQYALRAIKLCEELGPKFKETKDNCLDKLAWGYAELNRLAEAEAIYKRLLAEAIKEKGEESLGTATYKQKLATVYASQSRFTEAETLFREALATDRKLEGDKSIGVAMVYNGLASLFARQNRNNEAVACGEEAYKKTREVYGPEDPSTLRAMKNLAVYYSSVYRYDEARELNTKALEIRERVLGPNHPSIATSLLNLSIEEELAGKTDRIDAMRQRALKIREAAFGNENPKTLEAKCLIADSLFKSAAEKKSRALEAAKKGNLKEVENSLAKSKELRARGKALLTECFEVSKRNSGLDDPATVRYARDLSPICLHDKNPAAAEQYALLAFTGAAKTFGKGHSSVTQELLARKQLFWESTCRARIETRHQQYRQEKSRYVTESLAQSDRGKVSDAIKLLSGRLASNKNCNESTAKEFLVLADLWVAAKDRKKADQNYNHAIAILEKLPQSKNVLADCSEARAVNRMIFQPDKPIVADIERALALRGKDDTVSNALSGLDLYFRFNQIGIDDGDLLESSFYAVANLTERFEEDPSKIKPTLLYKSAAFDACMCLAYSLANHVGPKFKVHAGKIVRCAYKTVDLSTHSNDERALRSLEMAELFMLAESYARAHEELEKAEATIIKSSDQHLKVRWHQLGARICLRQGDYVGAMKLSNEAQSEKRITDVEDVELLEILCESSANLGLYSQDSSLVDTAIEAAEKALAIRKQKNDNEKERAPVMVTLAKLLLSKNKDREACDLLNRVLSACQNQTDAASRLTVADACTELASERFEAGMYDEAKALVSRALDIHENSNIETTDKICDHNMLAAINLVRRDDSGARAEAVRSAKSLDGRISTAFSRLSYAEQRAFLETVLDTATTLVSVCGQQPDSLEETYSYLMKWKGLLVEGLRCKSAAGVSKQNDESVRKLAEIRAELSEIGDVASKEAVERRELLTQQKELQERAISKGAATDPMSKLSTTSDFQGILKADEAFIDIWTFKNFAEKKVHYGAFILTAQGKPKFVDLGAADSLNQQIAALRNSGIFSQNSRDVVEDSEARIEDVDSQRIANAWNEIQSLVWNKIKAELPDGTTKLWICEDGELSRFPWNSFVIGEPGCRLKLCHVDSPRELVILRNGESSPENKDTAKTALLIGGIKYKDTAMELKGAAREVLDIQELANKSGIPTTLLTADMPTKKAVEQNLPNSRLVHFATHGYFVGSSEMANTRLVSRTVRVSSNKETAGSNRNPLIKSGLLLAAEESRSGESKLTAEDLVGIDLRNCELVTLSACDTGRGEEATGQGVIGLRSALMAAGAKAVLLSLWPVDDEATRELMKHLYTNLWVKKMDKAEALLQAQLSIKNDPHHPEWQAPRFWAAWELVGQGWE